MSIGTFYQMCSPLNLGPSISSCPQTLQASNHTPQMPLYRPPPPRSNALHQEQGHARCGEDIGRHPVPDWWEGSPDWPKNFDLKRWCGADQGAHPTHARCRPPHQHPLGSAGVTSIQRGGGVKMGRVAERVPPGKVRQHTVAMEQHH